MSAGWAFSDLEEELHATAVAKVGFEDFGDPSYLDGLRALLHAYDEDDRLSENGRMAARYDLQGTLIRRLRTEKLLRESAAALDYDVERPMFITGLVRTGSTALHYLMGRDPDLQPLPHWLAENPMPRPPRDQWEQHPRFRNTEKRLENLYAQDPSRAAMHFMTASLPEECGHLLAQSFTDDRYIVSSTLPSYAQWYENSEHGAAYARHRDLVKLIGSTDRGKRWLLKYPVHLRQLRALFAVYPDACIIQTHRDPLTVLRSYTNMVASYRRIFEDDIDRAEIARSQMESWAGAVERGIAAREDVGAEHFYDLDFNRFVADPIGAVKGIYERFDQPLSAQGLAALETWQDEHPRGAHGVHDYGDREFPLRADEVRERFAAYIEYFGLA